MAAPRSLDPLTPGQRQCVGLGACLLLAMGAVALAQAWRGTKARGGR